MKKILKTILIALALVLVIAAFTACAEITDKINNSLEHTGGTPSCTEQAICEGCGLPYGDLLPHRGGPSEGKAPTCEEDGYGPGTVCLDCGFVLKEGEKIDKLGHDMGDATCEEPASCKREGCSHQEGKPLGHAMGCLLYTSPSPRDQA